MPDDPHPPATTNAGRLSDWQADAAVKARQQAAAEQQSPSPAEPDADGAADAPDDADADAAPPKRRSFLRRHPIWVIVGVLALVAVAVVGYVAWLIFFYPYETTDDAFVDARQFTVAPKVSGYIADVPVTDNQHVVAGDIILRIEPTDYRIALDQARAGVESAKASVQSADAQIASAQAAVEQAKAQIEAAQAAQQFAQDEASRQNTLVKSGAGTLQVAQQARSNLQQAQAAFQQAEAALASSIKNVSNARAQKASAIAGEHEAEARVERAEQNLSYTTVTAAQAGQIVRLSGAKGQFVESGQSISMFVPDEKWVTANYKETQITDMRSGQPVDIRIDAYPDHPLAGRIDSVQPGSGTAFSLLPAQNATGNYVKVTQRVPVKIVIDRWPSDVPVGPGMSVVPTATVREPPAFVRPLADRLADTP